MTPEPKEIGHQPKFNNTLIGLIRKGCWHIPEIMGASMLSIVGLCLAAVGVHNYYKNDGDIREFRHVYLIMRPEDPRAHRLKNPVHTQYKC